MCIGEWLWMETNPARRIRREKEKKGRTRFLSDEERKNLLEKCKEIDRQLYTLVVLALSTGMRKVEITNLEWKDVDLEKGAIVLHETKNGERRRVPVRGLALEVLKEHGKVRQLDTNLVFTGNLRNHGYRFRPDWAEALKKAKITDFWFHDLRHSFASYLAMNGASLLEIAEVLGHKILVMVKRYSHLAESHTAGVVERMNQKIFG